jgi:hypothetical protein
MGETRVEIAETIFHSIPFFLLYMYDLHMKRRGYEGALGWHVGTVIVGQAVWPVVTGLYKWSQICVITDFSVSTETMSWKYISNHFFLGGGSKLCWKGRTTVEWAHAHVMCHREWHHQRMVLPKSSKDTIWSEQRKGPWNHFKCLQCMICRSKSCNTSKAMSGTLFWSSIEISKSSLNIQRPKPNYV